MYLKKLCFFPTKIICVCSYFLQLKCCGVNAVTAGNAGDFANTPNWTKGSKKIPTSCCVGVTASNYTAPPTCTDNVAAGTYYTSVCLNFILNVRLNF